MTLLIDILKDNWRLASPLFIVAMFGVGVALLHVRRLAPWGRRWLAALVLAYWFLATPMGASIVSAPLRRGYDPIVSATEVEEVQAIVVLGGGMRTHVHDGYALDDLLDPLRVIEAARLYSLLGNPTVIVSGGSTQPRLHPPRTEAAAMRNALVALGVPASRIQLEDRSRTTREQALLLKPMLAKPIDKFVLVSSPTHMGRSLATFRAVGLDPIPSVSPLRSQRSDVSWSLVPDRESLMISDGALYNFLAFGYYWAHGWLGTSPR